ncbi:zinc-dependent alcohol dehydrogenase [Chondromyces crocatus]|uniref:Alcohol dehydrogenase n=1 Tax=Chondromyces crocatus TaxID=52 RepID=A0A0K1ET78_CHOCO|nr:zinc-dependent alcohol dehydrogenase [Chondromyces crocatus]AKT44009.1 alcohol dehydrogenase [Chondromyces crocatus]
MKALVFHRPKHVSVDQVNDPRIEHPRDAIVRVTLTAICGSDLHIYNGLIPQVRPMVLGHEFMGIVEEVGPQITNLKRGDRVIVPFPIACGDCFFCKAHLPPHCERSNREHYGPEGGLLREKGGALFGYTDLYGGYDGGQAELVRIPYADVGPRKVPDELTDEQALFLTDILPTGWTAVDQAHLQGGETVAVFGCGPVGLMAMKAAWIKGAGRVIGIDVEDYRVEMARSATGAEVIHARRDDPVKAIRAMTDGRGADVCIDAVGMEARRSLWKKLANVVHGQLGSTEALETCFSAVRRGGMVSIVGVYGMPYDNFPVGQIFDKGLRLWAGQALAQNYVDELMALIVAGKIRTDDIITHRMPLSDAAIGYDLFNKKKDNCVKVVLTP